VNGQQIQLGGREGIRTLDLSVANAALSQLSYAPKKDPVCETRLEGSARI
jgi:hypothetical protein